MNSLLSYVPQSYKTLYKDILQPILRLTLPPLTSKLLSKLHEFPFRHHSILRRLFVMNFWVIFSYSQRNNVFQRTTNITKIHLKIMNQNAKFDTVFGNLFAIGLSRHFMKCNDHFGEIKYCLFRTISFFVLDE